MLAACRANRDRWAEVVRLRRERGALSPNDNGGGLCVPCESAQCLTDLGAPPHMRQRGGRG
eukprot:gene17988-10431_t